MKWFSALIIVFLFLALGSLAIGINPIRIMEGPCPSKEYEEFKQIKFVGYELTLPTKLITSCYAHAFENALDSDPARITIDAELPDFLPLKGVDYPKMYVSDAQIRIAITGVENSDTDAIKPDEQKVSLDNAIARKNRQGKPIYKKEENKSYGLIKYTSDKSIPIYSGDIYAFTAPDGEIDFYLDCVEDKEKHHRLWNCRSSSKSIYPGIWYHYYYNSKYLPHAKELDEKVAKLLTTRFIFSADKIASWKDIDQGFSIKLTKKAQQEFLELTRNNVNKPVEMYVETQLVSSPVIREPIGSGSMMLAVEPEMKTKILSLLPTPKQVKADDARAP